jgi:hypothetical protein
MGWYIEHVTHIANIRQSGNIRCNNAGALGTGVSGTIAAGDKVKAHWKYVLPSYCSQVRSPLTSQQTMDASTSISARLHGQVPRLVR